MCADDFAGVIRREDVRGWEIDKVRMEESFAVGDVVRAVVVSFCFLLFLASFSFFFPEVFNRERERERENGEWEG